MKKFIRITIVIILAVLIFCFLTPLTAAVEPVIEEYEMTVENIDSIKEFDINLNITNNESYNYILKIKNNTKLEDLGMQITDLKNNIKNEQLLNDLKISIFANNKLVYEGPIKELTAPISKPMTESEVEFELIFCILEEVKTEYNEEINFKLQLDSKFLNEEENHEPIITPGAIIKPEEKGFDYKYLILIIACIPFIFLALKKKK